MSEGHDQIRLTLSVADGRVAAVDLQPRRRPPLSRIFAGKPAETVATALPRLFSLCAAAHRIAFLSALDAAHAREIAPAALLERSHAVLVERLVELLRGVLIACVGRDGGAAAPVRGVLQAAMSLAAASAGHTPDESLARIKTGLAALGLCCDTGEMIPGRLLAALMADANDLGWKYPTAAEQGYLSPPDDAVIVRRLFDEGAGFADRPDLDGCVPETGVWARHVRRTNLGPTPATLPARRQAKLAEIVRLVDWLGHQPQQPFESAIVANHPLGPRRGAAAVECARGRLHHALELDDAGRLIRCEVLAPTEWNFHPRGPVVRTLMGAAVTCDDRDRITALVGAFDACVAVRVAIRELADA